MAGKNVVTRETARDIGAPKRAARGKRGTVNAPLTTSRSKATKVFNDLFNEMGCQLAPGLSQRQIEHVIALRLGE